jgi:hypothetical protein
MAGSPPYPPNFRSVQDLLSTFYGGPLISFPHDSDYTVGTTAAALGANRGQRIAAIMSNTGSTSFSISFSSAVTITTGILVNPGFALNLEWYYDGDLLSRTLWAISSGAGGTLHMIEQFLGGA